MKTYFEHVAGQGKRKETSFDVLEFDPQPAGIEVTEKLFDSTGEFCRYVAQQLGRAPE